MSIHSMGGSDIEGVRQSTAPGVPDINAETYPFKVVQSLLDRAAHFNMYSIPDPRRGSPIHPQGQPGRIIGVRISEVLHRFAVRVSTTTSNSDLRALNIVGETLARFEQRWMFIPWNFEALPEREPPLVVLDRSRSQRFVMLESVCVFAGGRDGFHGFGTGVTYPRADEPDEVLVGAVGDIREGFGKFAGLQGTYTYCGTLSAERGFLGNLMCRVVDPDGLLSGESDLTTVTAREDPEPKATYLLFRGQKRDREQRTGYRFGPAGDVTGLNVEQQLRVIQLDSGENERGELRSTMSVGPVMGRMTAEISFNVFDPGAPGTGRAPIPFKSYNRYEFNDFAGRVTGGFDADGSEGRTFNLTLKAAPRQRALRFGGFGSIVKSSGQLVGLQGLMTDNSVVGIAPHAISTLYVIRVDDPEGRFRSWS